MALTNAEELSWNWRENYFSELFSLSTGVFLFFRQFDSAQGKRARENERGARHALDDSQEKLRHEHVFFSGLIMAAMFKKKEHIKVTQLVGLDLTQL